MDVRGATGGEPIDLYSTGARGPSEYHEALFGYRRRNQEVRHKAILLSSPHDTAAPEDLTNLGVTRVELTLEGQAHEVVGIGHSNRSLADFMVILKRAGIRTLVDVRTNPASQYNPHFNRKALTQSLEQHGIGYVWEGELLGGKLPEYGGDFVKYMREDPDGRFTTGIQRLLNIIRREKNPVGILCSEKAEADCHRRYILDHLRKNWGHEPEPQTPKEPPSGTQGLLFDLSIVILVIAGLHGFHPILADTLMALRLPVMGFFMFGTPGWLKRLLMRRDASGSPENREVLVDQVKRRLVEHPEEVPAVMKSSELVLPRQGGLVIAGAPTNQTDQQRRAQAVREAATSNTVAQHLQKGSAVNRRELLKSLSGFVGSFMAPSSGLEGVIKLAFSEPLLRLMTPYAIKQMQSIAAEWNLQGIPLHRWDEVMRARGDGRQWKEWKRTGGAGRLYALEIVERANLKKEADLVLNALFEGCNPMPILYRDIPEAVQQILIKPSVARGGLTESKAAGIQQLFRTSPERIILERWRVMFREGLVDEWPTLKIVREWMNEVDLIDEDTVAESPEARANEQQKKEIPEPKKSVEAPQAESASKALVPLDHFDIRHLYPLSAEQKSLRKWAIETARLWIKHGRLWHLHQERELGRAA